MKTVCGIDFGAAAMSARVFIDGQSGTTGLGIQARLESLARKSSLPELPPAERKNPAAKADILRSVDLAILCLPNAAAEESVALISSAWQCGAARPRCLDRASRRARLDLWLSGT